MTDIKTLSLYQKLWHIQQEIKTVIKLGKNTFHGYNYAREQDILGEVKPLLGKYGIVITQNVVNYKLEIIKESSFMGTVEVDFSIHDVETNDCIVSKFIGQGEDKGDKSFPKALTMATKYFLAKTFLVETGDDSEQDKKGQKTKLEPNEAFEVAKKMILATKNVAGLIEYDGNMKAGKTFNAKQKAELHTLINSRVTTLTENGKK